MLRLIIHKGSEYQRKEDGLKVAVPAEGADLDAKSGDRLGHASHLVVVDLQSNTFEAFRTPRDSGNGSGMQMVALIIAKKCDVLLVKWCSPTAEKYLSAHGVRIVTGMSGTVAEIGEKFKNENRNSRIEETADPPTITWKIDREAAAQAFRSGSRQIRNLLPVTIGVIFLAGLFSAFLSEEFLSSLFSGSLWWDSFWGASLGSVFAGNPVSSYIIGGKLLELGVSLGAVTAFICSWVTVGLLQLPAEIAALGWKFAVVRNLSCFALSMAVSFAMTLIMKFSGA